MNDEIKRELTIKELEEQYKKMTEQCNALNEQINQKKKDEEARKQAQLSFEKDARRKEVEEAYDRLNTLVNNYIKDYGSLSFTKNNKNEHEHPYLWHWFF